MESRPRSSSASQARRSKVSRLEACAICRQNASSTAIIPPRKTPSASSNLLEKSARAKLKYIVSALWCISLIQLWCAFTIRARDCSSSASVCQRLRSSECKTRSDKMLKRSCISALAIERRPRSSCSNNEDAASIIMQS
ncbi:unnamed protein product [Phytomonas sp. Hart1]|nr:unnamed protein product [Phytomonas sp. Hart1]|eukprot:CCW67120.1 unnamed protein product [Phytomonas sp. isolate Hart1]